MLHDAAHRALVRRRASPLARASLRDTDLRLRRLVAAAREAGGRSRYTHHASATRRRRLRARPATCGHAAAAAAGRCRLLAQGAGRSAGQPLPKRAAAGGAAARCGAAASACAVRGRAWLDHEWSEQLLHPDAVGWDWIGMNLDDGGALTAFRLRRADGSSLWAGGSLRARRRRAARLRRRRACASRRWRTGPARRRGARYPVQWRIDTPAGALRGARRCSTRRNSTAAAAPARVYWEGLSELFDAQQRRVGSGYLEMTGYAGRLRLGD